MSEPKGLTDEEVAQACQEPDSSTEGFYNQHTMYRIKDAKKSLEFYTGVLGMRLLRKLDFPAMTFSLYFLGYANAADIPKDPEENRLWMSSQRGTLELTYNWGTENDPDFSYHNGNSEPRGYGHIAVIVPDVYKACQRMEQLGVKFIKKPEDGKMKGLAFIQDPDGYWIEILNPKRLDTK